MIHNFKVENFYSINEEQELDFTTNKKYSDSYGQYDNYYISKVNCFVGANASGKTNLFKALSFLLWFSENSFYKDIENDLKKLFVPHKLNKNKPTKFEIIFDIRQNLYRYSLILTPDELINEKLEIKSQKGYTFLYKLENVDKQINIKYNRNCDILPRINKKEEERFKLKKKATFLSFLIGIGYLDKIGLTGITNGCFRNVYSRGSISLESNTEAIILSKELEYSKQKSEILKYLKCFDLGIENYVHGMFKAKFPSETLDLIGFRHANKEQSFDLPILEESAGSIKGMYLLLNLLDVLEDGGIAIIDELDARLHYEIAHKIISLFANKDTNKNNAQLFFSTHQPLFLNDRDKTQIFLCYKEDYLNTEVYRLDDISGIRNTENFFEKYLTGEYGATPRIEAC